MNAKLVMGMSLALALTSCASTPRPNAALESARTAVQAAEANPNVSKYAALDLEAAKKQLDVAEMASTHHEDAAVARPAYLAAQTAPVAQAHPAAKVEGVR